MNCANHPDRERTAFCQNCGKPLCNECVRNVGSSIFCEPCLAARVAGAPAAGYAPGYAAVPPTPVMPAEPNPGIAALLGFIPGVGAMYNGQYAKGIVHLMVFALLVSLASDVNGIFGLFVAGWIAYMVIEAHHTAKARRDGTPLPNPFGLNDLSERLGFGKAWPGTGTVADPSTFVPPASGVPPANPYAAPYTYVPPAASWSAPGGPVGYGPGTYQPGAYDPAAYAAPPVPPAVPSVDPDLAYYRRFPAGAIWLIVLGLFFLLGDSSLFHFFHGRFLGPMLLIGLAVWVFVSKMTKTGYGIENDGTAFYHWRLTRAVRSSFWLALTGVVWLLDELHILSWSRSWPIFVIGAGVMMIFRNTYSGYGYAPVPPMPSPPPPAAPVAGTAIVPAAPQSSISNDQEGR